MTVDFTGKTISGVDCEGQLCLVTDDGWLLTIENDYSFQPASGGLLMTENGEEDAIVAMLASAVGSTISSFAVTGDGGLRLQLSIGLLRVAASPRFESWSVVGPDRERLVSLPGGELAVWD